MRPDASQLERQPGPSMITTACLPASVLADICSRWRVMILLSTSGTINTSDSPVAGHTSPNMYAWDAPHTQIVAV
jgi:hypothetical protein